MDAFRAETIHLKDSMDLLKAAAYYLYRVPVLKSQEDVDRYIRIIKEIERRDESITKHCNVMPSDGTKQ